jgi:ketosteroid isomerase-like protein
MLGSRFGFVSCLILWSAFANAQQQDTALVREVLNLQQQAWNKGDIEGYMQGYWKSDSLAFIGKKGITYGWKQTLANYQKSYPNKAAMGSLLFDLRSIQQVSADAVYVIGKWHLKRTKDLGDLQGHFTLLFKKVNNQWVIVADHSS